MNLLATSSIGSCHECVATLTLPLALFLVLTETAAGGIGTVAYLRAAGGLTSGFLKFVALTYAVLGGLALLVVWAGPPANYHRLFGLNQVAAGTLVFLQALALLSLLVLIVMIYRGKQASSPGWWLVIATSAGLLLTIAVVFWPLEPTLLDGAALIGLVVVSSIVLGAATTGMLLGHWYLVTPALTNRPLLRAIALLLAGLLAQAAVFPIALAGLRHASGSPLDAFGLAPVLSWLWLLGAVILPILAAVPAFATCRIRSFMSTTGLLYLAMIALLPGQLLGQLLLFVAAASA
jgi:hypothetical protein